MTTKKIKGFEDSFVVEGKMALLILTLPVGLAVNLSRPFGIRRKSWE